MYKFKILFPAFAALVFVSIYFWRLPAPSYKGQNLHVALDVAPEFEILFIGDTGSGDARQYAVAEAMNTYCQTHPVAAVVLLGDNFYPKGVDSVEDGQWNTKFLKPYGLDCLRKLPFYALLGNHDYRQNPAAQIAFKSAAPSWNMPHRFYDIKAGDNLLLTLIDTNKLDLCGFSNYCTVDFLFKSLRRSAAPFKIVLGHHPITSSSGKYRRSFQGTVLERLMCVEGSIYIAGHSHHLEHLKSKECDLDFFIVGGGGADLYDLDRSSPKTQFAKASLGFMSVNVQPAQLSFSFHDEALNTLYTYKRRAVDTPEVASQ